MFNLTISKYYNKLKFFVSTKFIIINGCQMALTTGIDNRWSCNSLDINWLYTKCPKHLQLFNQISDHIHKTLGLVLGSSEGWFYVIKSNSVSHLFLSQNLLARKVLTSSHSLKPWIILFTALPSIIGLLTTWPMT